MLDLLIAFLAVLGVIAITLRLIGSLLGFGLTAVEASASRTLAEASARRGDLTGMMERREAAVALRRRRLRAVARLSLWLGLLIVPPVLGVGRIVYAVASVLWLMRLPRVRVQVARGRSEPS